MKKSGKNSIGRAEKSKIIKTIQAFDSGSLK